ncbi:hypothetical protein PR048_006950 [Dryococelus australis]|uniref:Tc1-like transposase DDE domain-containing protein n=1 Tax=Dryococelus australis TaxID=614101 RepID=A0ABQ9ICD5_9NEOP|nr:hypothetical protein PR048_006950 [Dryococelus australis]
MERHRNATTEDPRENPPTSGIVWHDSGSRPAGGGGDRTRIALLEGGQLNSSAAAALLSPVATGPVCLIAVRCKPYSSGSPRRKSPIGRGPESAAATGLPHLFQSTCADTQLLDHAHLRRSICTQTPCPRTLHLCDASTDDNAYRIGFYCIACVRFACFVRTRTCALGDDVARRLEKHPATLLAYEVEHIRQCYRIGFYCIACVRFACFVRTRTCALGDDVARRLEKHPATLLAYEVEHIRQCYRIGFYCISCVRFAFFVRTRTCALGDDVARRLEKHPATLLAYEVEHIRQCYRIGFYCISCVRFACFVRTRTCALGDDVARRLEKHPATLLAYEVEHIRQCYRIGFYCISCVRFACFVRTRTCALGDDVARRLEKHPATLLAYELTWGGSRTKSRAAVVDNNKGGSMQEARGEPDSPCWGSRCSVAASCSTCRGSRSRTSAPWRQARAAAVAPGAGGGASRAAGTGTSSSRRRRRRGPRAERRQPCHRRVRAHLPRGEHSGCRRPRYTRGRPAAALIASRECPPPPFQGSEARGARRARAPAPPHCTGPRAATALCRPAPRGALETRMRSALPPLITPSSGAETQVASSVPTTMQWYADNNVRRLDWPAQIPDLNPIEHLWDELDRRARARQARPKSIAQLMEWLQEEWRRIPVDILQTLVESIADRVAASCNAIVVGMLLALVPAVPGRCVCPPRNLPVSSRNCNTSVESQPVVGMLLALVPAVPGRCVCPRNLPVSSRNCNTSVESQPVVGMLLALVPAVPGRCVCPPRNLPVSSRNCNTSVESQPVVGMLLALVPAVPGRCVCPRNLPVSSRNCNTSVESQPVVGMLLALVPAVPGRCVCPPRNLPVSSRNCNTSVESQPVVGMLLALVPAVPGRCVCPRNLPVSSRNCNTSVESQPVVGMLLALVPAVPGRCVCPPRNLPVSSRNCNTSVESQPVVGMLLALVPAVPGRCVCPRNLPVSSRNCNTSVESQPVVGMLLALVPAVPGRCVCPPRNLPVSSRNCNTSVESQPVVGQCACFTSGTGEPMRVRRGEHEAALRCKDGGRGSSLRKPGRQWRKSGGRAHRESSPVRLAPGGTLNSSASQPDQRGSRGGCGRDNARCCIWCEQAVVAAATNKDAQRAIDKLQTAGPPQHCPTVPRAHTENNLKAVHDKVTTFEMDLRKTKSCYKRVACFLYIWNSLISRMQPVTRLAPGSLRVSGRYYLSILCAELDGPALSLRVAKLKLPSRLEFITWLVSSTPVPTLN